jgi:hypothetical protein
MILKIRVMLWMLTTKKLRIKIKQLLLIFINKVLIVLNKKQMKKVMLCLKICLNSNFLKVKDKFSKYLDNLLDKGNKGKVNVKRLLTYA